MNVKRPKIGDFPAGKWRRALKWVREHDIDVRDQWVIALLICAGARKSRGTHYRKKREAAEKAWGFGLVVSKVVDGIKVRPQ